MDKPRKIGRDCVSELKENGYKQYESYHGNDQWFVGMFQKKIGKRFFLNIDVWDFPDGLGERMFPSVTLAVGTGDNVYTTNVDILPKLQDSIDLIEKNYHWIFERLGCNGIDK